MDINLFLDLFVEKKEFYWAPPMCFIPNIKIQDRAKAMKVYNWIRVFIYANSILNVVISFLIILLFMFHGNHKTLVRQIKP